MGSEQIRRWESGALAHAVTDPFGQGPVPWLRGDEQYFDDTGHVVPWYIDHIDHVDQAGRAGQPGQAGGPGGSATLQG
ncbi:phosphoribosylamine--glycine ligase, partial [Streptomyces sp. NPDC057927]